MNSGAVVSVNNLSIGYGGNSVASDINFNLLSGETVTLLGSNGSGKSTLLKTLTKEIESLNGSIEICNSKINSIKHTELARLVSVVTTEKIAVGGLRVKELVSLGRHPHTGFTGKLSDKDYNIIDESMESVGISNLAERFIATLSDGERQKAMIARAIAQQTPVMFLDEPFSFIDPAARIEIFSALRKLTRTQNKAILLSSHDVFLSLKMADRIFMLTPQKRFYSGTPDDIVKRNIISELFDNTNIEFDKSYLEFIERHS